MCASAIDIRFCKNCEKPIEITITEESLARQDYDLTQDKELTYKFKIKKIHFSGGQWKYICKYIHEKDNVELAKLIEYYKAIASLMEDEILTRKLAKQKAEIIYNNTTKSARISVPVLKPKKPDAAKSQLDKLLQNPDARRAFLDLFTKGKL